jgi:excinuclease ABC subunit A
VEHNLQLMRSADYLIDLGPGAGDDGGQIVVQGTPEEVAAYEESVTGRFLRSSPSPVGRGLG